MENKEVVAVKIGQMTYNLSAVENTQYIEEIAQEADGLIKQISDNNPGLSPANIAILALVNVLDQKTKYELENSLVKGDTEAYHAKINELSTALLNLRETSWELKKELLYYKNLCEVYEDRIDELSEISNTDKLSHKINSLKGDLKPLDKLQTSFSDLTLNE